MSSLRLGLVAFGIVVALQAPALADSDDDEGVDFHPDFVTDSSTHPDFYGRPSSTPFTLGSFQLAGEGVFGTNLGFGASLKWTPSVQVADGFSIKAEAGVSVMRVRPLQDAAFVTPVALLAAWQFGGMGLEVGPELQVFLLQPLFLARLNFVYRLHPSGFVDRVLVSVAVPVTASVSNVSFSVGIGI